MFFRKQKKNHQTIAVEENLKVGYCFTDRAEYRTAAPIQCQKHEKQYLFYPIGLDSDGDYTEIALECMEQIAKNYDIFTYMVDGYTDVEWNRKRKPNWWKNRFVAKWYHSCVEMGQNTGIWYAEENGMIQQTKGLCMSLMGSLAEEVLTTKHRIYGYRQIPDLANYFDETLGILEAAEWDIYMEYHEEHDYLVIGLQTKTIDVEWLKNILATVCEKYGKDLIVE